MESDARSEARRLLLETPAGELARRRAEIQDEAERAGYSAKEIQDTLNARSDLPRELLPGERDALIMSLERLAGPDREVLLAQAATAQVDRYSCRCPCASVGLRVDREHTDPARSVGYHIDGVSMCDAEGALLGSLEIFLHDGYLDDLEVSWFDVCSFEIPMRDRLTFEPVDVLAKPVPPAQSD